MAEAKPSSSDNIDFLKCAICLEEMKEPKTLPCMHNFCKVCLGLHIEKETETSNKIVNRTPTVFTCPLCRKTTLPVDTLVSVKLWAGQFPTNSLVLAFKKVKEMKTCKKFCAPCQVNNIPDKQANLWCKECNVFFCSNCKAMHDVFNSGHTFFPTKNITDDIVQKIRPARKCLKHNEDLKYFCVNHESLGCQKCITLKHRHCLEIQTAEKRSQKIKRNECLHRIIEQYSEAIGDLNEWIEVANSRSRSLEQEKCQAEDRMEKLKEDLINHLNILYENDLEIFTKEFKQEKEKNETKIKRCEQLKVAMENSRLVLKTTLKYGDASSVVSAELKGKQEYCIYQRNLEKEFQSNSINRLCISPSSIVADLQSLTSIGTVGKMPDFYNLSLPRSFDLYYHAKTRLLKSFVASFPSDTAPCSITGLLFLQKNRILAVDHGNQKVKLFTNDGEPVSQLCVFHSVWGICEMDPGCLAVSGGKDKKITKISVERDKLILKQTLHLDFEPFGIAFKYRSFVVTTGEDKLRVLSTTGTFHYETEGDSSIKHLLVLPNSGDLVVSRDVSGVCATLLQGYKDVKSTAGRYDILTSDLHSWSKGKYEGACGMASDRHDNIYVCLKDTNHVLLVKTSKEMKVFLSGSDGISSPCAISVLQDQLVLAESNSNTLKLFKLF